MDPNSIGGISIPCDELLLHILTRVVMDGGETRAVANQVVIFRIGKETYGVEIGHVREVVAWSQPRPLPGSPPHVEGVLSLRGEVIPVLDLGKRFGASRALPDEESRILVVEVGGQVAGVIVDTVTEVLTLANQSVHPVAPAIRNPNDPLVAGIVQHGEELIVLVNLERVVGEGQAALAEQGQTT